MIFLEGKVIESGVRSQFARELSGRVNTDDFLAKGLGVVSDPKRRWERRDLSCVLTITRFWKVISTTSIIIIYIL